MPGAQEVSGTFWPGRACDRERKSYFDMQPMMLLFHEGDLEPFLPVLMPTYDLDMILARFGERGFVVSV